jgi:hypothetical protein
VDPVQRDLGIIRTKRGKAIAGVKEKILVLGPIIQLYQCRQHVRALGVALVQSLEGTTGLVPLFLIHEGLRAAYHRGDLLGSRGQRLSAR